MDELAQTLKEWKKERDFLIGVDSDGCVFDTMEIKHKECFIPNTIRYWGLQAVAKYVRETAEFVNLYSKWRGLNRFPALIKLFDMLAERAELKGGGFKFPAIASLREWVATETKLGNPALARVAVRQNDPVLKTALTWSEAVNDAIAVMIRGVPPYPLVRESLRKMQRFAQGIVISQTPREALEREWNEHDLARYLTIIAGQELGTKGECLGLAKAAGEFQDDRVLMIGDAPGDLEAARANRALFYPIIPGNEEISWQRFHEEAFEYFIRGQYRGDYEEKLIAEFEKALPALPPWQKSLG